MNISAQGCEFFFSPGYEFNSGKKLKWKISKLLYDLDIAIKICLLDATTLQVNGELMAGFEMEWRIVLDWTPTKSLLRVESWSLANTNSRIKSCQAYFCSYLSLFAFENESFVEVVDVELMSRANPVHKVIARKRPPTSAVLRQVILH